MNETPSTVYTLKTVCCKQNLPIEEHTCTSDGKKLAYFYTTKYETSINSQCNFDKFTKMNFLAGDQVIFYFNFTIFPLVSSPGARFI